MVLKYQSLDIGNQSQFKQIKTLVDNDLSEPYSVWVYRFFLNNWPGLTYIVIDTELEEEKNVIGCIICKNELHRNTRRRGYIGMLVVNNEYRGQGIAKNLVKTAINKMKNEQCDEIMLETEVSNTIAIKLYENMGFLKMKRLFRYYLNEGDAYRLILPLTEKSCIRSTFLGDASIDI
ncbi:hypothetical protein TPHA_0A03750 [Tetrapisispora phaffii CBS 4417]|uniref:N-acetyltransferase domain-containing protein n=1 Tax=Tetrapisispora phaffii (strain ATCC 24235 / CBS 4417 / NBRC 1672 / NRRL Y-8282 / UCD 70-5) TaxID=1071381 RepID=G8BNH3_TETPH|nr:hypothetical protein TPHA_0A03750 [Tetrapisispora phaffii CBS 4417]CCE61451.1 hypothetical protein TPHA_0A03750 [Tetrapisispora phaffii CBS 4417]